MFLQPKERDAVSPNEAEPVRFKGISREARRILGTHGESGRFEFKANSKAVDQTVLVAAANWVALSADRTHVTILVGVEEVVDATTGLTTGRPVGLSGNDLSVHVRRIQDYARTTRPVPVGLRIVEEGTGTRTPFLRVEVRPTFPPHFDSSGRRVTRDGASQRALMDEELLAIYLDREARQFQSRFETTAQRTIDAVEAINHGLVGVSDELQRLPGLIDNAESAAYMAGSEAEDSRRDIGTLHRRMEQLESKLARHLNDSPINVFLRLRYERERVWRAFNVDRLMRRTKVSGAIAPRLLAYLNAPIDPEAHPGMLCISSIGKQP